MTLPTLAMARYREPRTRLVFAGVLAALVFLLGVQAGSLPRAEARMWNVALTITFANCLSNCTATDQFQINLPDPSGSVVFNSPVFGVPIMVRHTETTFSLEVNFQQQVGNCIGAFLGSGSSGRKEEVADGLLFIGGFTGLEFNDCPFSRTDHPLAGRFTAWSRGPEVTVQVSGTVEVSTLLGFRPITSGFRLTPGDVIRTGNGTATLTFPDGSQLQILPGSVLSIGAINPTIIDQFRGFLHHFVLCLGPSLVSDAPCYQTRYSEAVTGVRGTEFSTESIEAGLTATFITRVLTGTVSVTDCHAVTTLVGAGQSLPVSCPLSRVRLILPVSSGSFFQGIPNNVSWTSFNGAAGYLIEVTTSPAGFSQPHLQAPQFPNQTFPAVGFSQANGVVTWPLFVAFGTVPNGLVIQWRVFPVDSAGRVLAGTTASDAFKLVLH